MYTKKKLSMDTKDQISKSQVKLVSDILN